MSVCASLNFADGTWEFVVEPESHFPNIEVGFREGNNPAVFDGLAFGLTVTVNGQKRYAATYPPEGVAYKATDQTYISSDRVALAADDVATLAVWAENGGVWYDDEVTFTIPRPPQPYPSWTWSDGWQPPIPYPDDENFYEWDEETFSWATVDPNSGQGDLNGTS